MASVQSLNTFSTQFSVYLGIVILVAGVVGNLLDIIVFLSLKTFRESSCAFYLTAMAFLNTVQLLFSLLPRIMNLWLSIDWSVTSLAYCKARAYIFQLCSLVSFTCMCLATIDQFLSTSSKAQWQRFSSIKAAHRSFIVATVVWILHGIPTLIYQDFVKSSTGNYSCAISNQAFQSYYTYGFVLVLVSCLPVLVTGIFGLMAYRNVSQLVYRAVPLVRRELDKQLTVMVLVQVVSNFVVLIPYIIANTINLGVTGERDPYTSATIQLARNVTITFYYWYYAGPFYIYICVSERFRKQLIHALFGICGAARPGRTMTLNQITPENG